MQTIFTIQLVHMQEHCSVITELATATVLASAVHTFLHSTLDRIQIVKCLNILIKDSQQSFPWIQTKLLSLEGK